MIESEVVVACKVDESPPPPALPSSTELLLGDDANEDVKVVVVSASVAAGVIVVDPQMNEQGQILGMGSAASTPLLSAEKSGTRPNKKTRSKEKNI